MKVKLLNTEIEIGNIYQKDSIWEVLKEDKLHYYIKCVGGPNNMWGFYKDKVEIIYNSTFKLLDKVTNNIILKTKYFNLEIGSKLKVAYIDDSLKHIMLLGIHGEFAISCFDILEDK